MDRVNKFLQHLSKKEFFETEKLVEQVLAGDIAHLQVKKLKGATHFFRVRKGDIRIIFQRKEGVVRIVEIGRRGEQTYRHITK